MRIFLLIAVFIISLQTFAEPTTNFTFISEVQEGRYQVLLSELRCLVCQNQSLAESNAPLAQDLKKEVYDEIKSGQTDEEIKQYLVARYGEYILFKPRVTQTTLILWLGPLIFLLGSLLILGVNIKRQSDVTRNELA